ncbi:hypothetical protein F4818DRAFT_295769 [Hypoxylon cercidicola]|nr:hypothetical protein F4818DRAFT_295769 [Hypoxylon cercidicola]
MARFHELERAACDVINNVRQINELRNAKLSVIGGLAVWHYLPKYRPTDNINFITNLSTSPSSLKKRLLEKQDSPFFQRSQALFYKSPKGQEIRVDISPQWLGPYLPESATKVEDLSQDEIPYISLTDLIVFKLDSSGLRSNPLKKDRDARDAAALVDYASNHGTIELNEKQEQVVEEALCDVGKCGTKEKSWWEEQMGLNKTPPATPSEQGQKSKQGRPHSKSDPTPSRSQSAKLSDDPNTAWHYEQLDQPQGHVHRFKALHSDRPGIKRSSSHRLLRDIGFIMTHPKTTLAGMVKQQQQNAPEQKKSSGSEVNRVPADPTYSDECYDDDEYYTLEPRGCSPAPEGYFDVPSPHAAAPVVTEVRPVGVRRASKMGPLDISPPQTPSLVTAPRRPPLKGHRSVSFVL